MYLDVCCPVCHETWDTSQCDEYPDDDGCCRLCGVYLDDPEARA